MGFELGHKKLGGRKKGSLNKRTIASQLVFEKNNHCPISNLIEISNMALQFSKIDPISALEYLKLAAYCNQVIIPYAYPKLKNIESEESNQKLQPTLSELMEKLDNEQNNSNS